MAITVLDRKLLWGRSGNRCAFPDCRRDLVITVSLTATTTVVGQECHIVAQSPAGPRGDTAAPLDDRYENLILLCPDHHKVVDDDPSNWTSHTLRTMKMEHEAWVRSALSPGSSTDESDLRYAEIVDGWAVRAHFDDWQAWTSHLLSGRPSLRVEHLRDLRAAHEWLYRRIWPGTRKMLEDALGQARVIAHDLSMVVERAFVPWGDDAYIIDVFYKNDWHSQDVYDQLSAEFEWIVDLIHDLVFELTRACNHVCDAVRAELDPRYRTDEGALVVEREQGVFEFVQRRPTYSAADLANWPPYDSLAGFSEARAGRDVWFGDGLNDAAFRRVTPIRLEE